MCVFCIFVFFVWGGERWTPSRIPSKTRTYHSHLVVHVHVYVEVPNPLCAFSPLWICLQEKAHVAGKIYQRRELSARAAFFFFFFFAAFFVDGGSIN